MSEERSIGIAGAAQPGLSKDARALMLYDANRKSALVAYLLWFFLGLLGAHNFYLRRNGTAITQLILTITVVGSALTLIWILIDAFLIPGRVRRLNNELANELSKPLGH
jgi:TM2 domain-containing membrane protein YozV